MCTLYVLNLPFCISIHRLHVTLNLLFAHTEWNHGLPLTHSAKYHDALSMLNEAVMFSETTMSALEKGCCLYGLCVPR